MQSAGSSQRDRSPHRKAQLSRPLPDNPDLIEEEAERTLIPCSDSFRGRFRAFDIELQAATAIQQSRRQPHLKPIGFGVFTDKVAKVVVVKRH